jgi:hypothetical protein
MIIKNAPSWLNFFQESKASTNEIDLAYRFEHIINLNNLLNKYETNEAAASERSEATKEFQSRFDQLMSL